MDTAITISCLDPLFGSTAEDITCFSYDDGIIEGFMSGGTGELTLGASPALGVNISGEGTVNFEVTDLSAADYLLQVEDANGCITQTNVSIAEPAPVTIELLVTDLPCAEACDGEVNIAAFGGSGVFDYSVTDAEENEYADSGLCVGDYLANATDENGCVCKRPLL